MRDLFCIGCGEYLEAQEEERVEEESAPPVAPACGDCGTEINPDEIFLYVLRFGCRYVASPYFFS